MGGEALDAVDASLPMATLSSESGISRCRPVPTEAGAGVAAAIARSMTVPLAVTSATDWLATSAFRLSAAVESAVDSEYLLASLRSLSASDKELALS